MSTLIVGAVVFAVIGFAGYSVYRSRRKGDGCGCGCPGCAKGKEDCDQTQH